MKKVGDISVNDGKGLFDNDGLCDSLLNDLNNLPKTLANGQYIQFCAVVSNMAQKIINLKNGIRNDMDSMKAKVEELKRTNDELANQLTGLPVEKDGAEHD